ncbi:cytochrome c-type biogenesis protein CcmH [Sinorhizobium medicae]|nr:cytochrome c-type biogenesis protein CcmH [Sinorhizobium medicae]MDX1172382.1 cytochrome c-type biogenesis protein CcmH [Sinorhizobium medicae]
MIRLLLALLLLLASAMPGLAVNPDEVLADPALETRARAISAQLRCMVCQNQSIDDSNAELAKDLRVLVRARLKSGDTDEAVISYVVSRYGEFVLLNPRFEARTLVLWGMPAILLVIGVITLVLAARRRGARVPAAPLSDEEQERLDRLLRP